MGASGPVSGRRYKIKLASGRIVGPIDLERVRLLVIREHIQGDEVAREYPSGEWVSISRIEEIADLLTAKLEGKLDDSTLSSATPAFDPSGETVILPQEEIWIEGEEEADLADLQFEGDKEDGDEEEEERTQIADPAEGEEEEEATQVGFEADLEDMTHIRGGSERASDSPLVYEDQPEREVATSIQEAGLDVANDPTIVFSGDRAQSVAPAGAKRKYTRKELLRFSTIALLIVLLTMELFFPEEEETAVDRAFKSVRPQLPAYVQGRVDPEKSKKLASEAVKYYLQDTVEGYRRAAEHYLASASYDINNVEALAMLASTYLNLIDSSNKDENYFAVISKLIEMSRAKSVDLPQTVIADVEFYITINNPEAAQNRIIEYTKTHKNYGAEMFFYLGYAFFARGDYQNAARYLSQIPDKSAFSPKVFYLRGRVAQELGSSDEALAEYQKAVRLFPNHAKSKLRTIEILAEKGKLREADKTVEFLATHPHLLSPREIARTHYMRGRLNLLKDKEKDAIRDFEVAVRLDRHNHDYRLELYGLMGRVMGSDPELKKVAQMYYFLGEGEKQLKSGAYREALNRFLQARQVNFESYVPLVKIGDMFLKLNDVVNARENFKKAAEMAPDSSEVWSRYVEVLIQSYEWEEANKAMARFKRMPGARSSVDKLAGDMYARQGQWAEALAYYKKAMSQESIDSDVYIAFADSLMKTGNYKDAPFFYALARRFDPLNLNAIVGTARSLAETESADRGITFLQDELQKMGGVRAEILAAVADLQLKQGNWKQSRETAQRAVQVDPDYAPSYLVMAKSYQGQEGTDRKALEKALEAFKSYSERNPSDPAGYLERYKIFIKMSKFEEAGEELNRIFAVYPKYPGLHFYKGHLFYVMGNYKEAVNAFKEEIKNHPDNVSTLTSLGKTLLEADQAKEALGYLNRAMQIDPRSAEGRHLAGWANYLLKNFDGSLALLRGAAQLDEGNPLIWKRLCLVHHEMGDAQSASEACSRYLELAPDAADKDEIRKYIR